MIAETRVSRYGPLDLIVEAYAAGVAFSCSGWRSSWTAPLVIVEALEVERDAVLAVLAGVRSGHYFAPCSSCGEWTLVRRQNKPPCRFTPGCKGKHVGRALPLSIARAIRKAEPWP